MVDEFSRIATAPGDLPPGEVARRLDAMRDQFRHDNTIHPLAPGSPDHVTIEACSGAAVGVEEASVLYTTDGTPPHEDSPRIQMERTGVDAVPFGGIVTRWSCLVPPQPEGTVVRYRVRGYTGDRRRIFAQDGQGFWYRYPPEEGVTTFAYFVSDRLSAPPWLSDSVIYHIFVDRFRRSAGALASAVDRQAKQGGTLAGIREALAQLHDLGVNCLWLSPVGPSPSYHRYDTTDLRSVDPLLGDEADLRRLTARARAMGMRVLLDFVPSHVSLDHPAFRAACRDRQSETHDWFVFPEWPTRYRCFLEAVRTMPSINTSSAGARKHLIDAMRYWIDCGIDGFRFDHVIGHGMDFWVEVRRTLADESPQVATIGEATDTIDAVRRYRGKLSAVLDFPLARAFRHTFATETWSLAAFDSFLGSYDEYLRDGPNRASFLDNHDMDRFLYLAGQDKDALRMATLVLLTLPPTPVIYYGTEVGMSQKTSTSNRRAGGDALAREPFPGEERWDHDLRACFQQLIRFRKDNLEQIHGCRRRLFLDSATDLYAYELCAAEADARRLTVIVNRSRGERRFLVDDRLDEVLTTGVPCRWGEPSAQGARDFAVPPRTAVVLRGAGAVEWREAVDQGVGA